MFFEPGDPDHGLRHNPLLAIVGPRPIGWISTLDGEGRTNLAPYSFFNMVSDRPPIIAFSSKGRKDSLAAIEETGEFVCNFVSYDLRRELNASSAPHPRGVSEFDAAGLEAAPSRLVATPRVAAAPAALECRRLSIIALDTISGVATPTPSSSGRWSGPTSTTASCGTAGSIRAPCARSCAPVILTISKCPPSPSQFRGRVEGSSCPKRASGRSNGCHIAGAVNGTHLEPTRPSFPVYSEAAAGVGPPMGTAVSTRSSRLAVSRSESRTQ